MIEEQEKLQNIYRPSKIVNVKENIGVRMEMVNADVRGE